MQNVAQRFLQGVGQSFLDPIQRFGNQIGGGVNIQLTKNRTNQAIKDLQAQQARMVEQQKRVDETQRAKLRQAVADTQRQIDRNVAEQRGVIQKEVRAPSEVLKAGAGTAATTVGLLTGASDPIGLAKFAATSGGLGGLFSGVSAAVKGKKPSEIIGDVAQGAGEFTGRAPAVFGVVHATDPLLAGALGKASLPIQKFLSTHGASAVSQPLVRRGLPALLNVAQGAPVNVATGQQAFTPESVATDLATGALFGPGQFSSESIFSGAKKDFAGKTMGQLQEASQRKQGLGLLADFDIANRTRDPLKIQAAAKAILASSDPKYAAYKKPIGDTLERYATNPMTIEAFHGEGIDKSPIMSAIKKPTYGAGKYYSTDPVYAGYFGTAQKEKVSFDNPLLIKGDNDLQEIANKAAEARLEIGEWAKQQGYDGIINKADDTIIKFGPREGAKTNLAQGLLREQEQVNPLQPNQGARFLKQSQDNQDTLNGGKPILNENPIDEATQPSFLNQRMAEINRATTNANPPQPTSFLESRIAAVNKATTPESPLSAFESSIRSNKKEAMAFFNDKGESLYQTASGGKYSAKIPVEDAGKTTGAVMTSHNHHLVDPANPNSELNAIALAPDMYDIKQAIDKGVKEVRTVSPIGVISNKIPDNLDPTTVRSAFEQASVAGQNAFKQALSNGENQYYANVRRVKAENDALISGLGMTVTKTASAQTPEAPKTGFLSSVKEKLGGLFGKKPPATPPVMDAGSTQRGFITTVKESPQASQPLKDLVSGTYDPKANVDLLNTATARVAKDPVGAMQFAMNESTDESVATANLLIKKLSSEGNNQAAADLVNTKARQLTEAGRTIQAASLFDSLTPESIGRLAARTIQKYNIAAKQKIPELNGDQLQAFQDMAKKYQSLPEGSEKTAARSELLQALATLTPKSWTRRLVDNLEEAVNIPRAIMATGDLSAPLRQGIFLVGRPKQWMPAFRDMFKYALSEKTYTDAMEDIKASPNYEKMQNSGLALTDPSSPILSGREEAFMSNLVEKIPGFGQIAKGSNRAYSGFLNKLRASTFDDLYQKAGEQGILKERSEVAKDIANFVNTATGRGNLPGSLERAAVALNGVFFSPRLMASRLSLLNPVYYAKLDPFVRRQALNSLMSFAATAITVTSLAKLAGADVSDDPRSSDFGKIKVGNTRYDPWGGFQQYIVAATRLLSGQMVSSTTGKEIHLGEGYKPTTRLDIAQRVFEAKEAPVASFITSLLRGNNAVGEPFELPREIADRFIPMLYQDIYDLQKEWGAKGYAMAIPGVFGVGSQTYGDQIPMKGKTATGRPNVQWRQEPGLGETLINKVTGKQLSNIPESEWAPLQKERKDETMQKIAEDKVKAEVLSTGEPQKVGGKYFYLYNGVLKTRDLGTQTKKKTISTYKAPSLFKAKSAPKLQSSFAPLRTKKTKATGAIKTLF